MRRKLAFAGVTGALLVALYLYSTWLCFVVMAASATVAGLVMKQRQDDSERHQAEPTRRPPQNSDIEYWAGQYHLVNRGNNLGRKLPTGSRNDWH